MAKQPLKFSVGLEIHARLNTRRKIFCACLNRYGDDPNANTCPVCLGLPGSLPVLNPEVLEPALRTALALECRVAPVSEFSRKNYFYPDLPRNFQITQYDRPLAEGGFLEAGNPEHRIRVRLQRIHLEEDAGRSLRHVGQPTRVDMNRAGAPLIEIVTEPDLENGKQARLWLRRLVQVLRYLGVCDGEMESGSLRCDANVGVLGDSPLNGPWIELKNLNSFKAVSLAVNHEIERLSRLWEDGLPFRRETRSWDARSRETHLLRTKEAAAEYRYFPEPDLPVLRVESRVLAGLRRHLPEMPEAKERRFSLEFGVKTDDAVTLCRSLPLAEYFQGCVRALVEITDASASEAGKIASMWVLSQILEAVGGQDTQLPKLKLGPEKLAEILGMVQTGKIQRAMARTLVENQLAGEDSGDLGDLVVSLSEGYAANIPSLNRVCSQVLEDHPKKIAQYLKGKNGLLNFFVGQVLAQSGGFFPVETARELLLKQLEEMRNGPKDKENT